MVIVLPFFESDSDLAVKTLKVIASLGSGLNHDCILHTPLTDVSHHRELAECSFRSVKENIYEDIRQPAGWPAGANHAFMRALTYMSEQAQSWFWLEPDALPLRADAFDVIERYRPEYEMAGVWMDDMAHHGYINGVARYSPSTLKLSPAMAFHPNEPFDIMLGHIFNGSRVDASKIMFNFPRAFHLHSHAKGPEFMHWLLNTGRVLFHGCTDGSMHDWMLGKRPINPVSYSVPINHECLRVPMDRAASFWHWEAARIAKDGWRLTKPWKVRLEIPPFTRQTQFESGYFPLPHSPLVVHFNPALVRDESGKLILITRQWKRARQEVGIWDSTLQRFEVSEPGMQVKHVGQLNMRRDSQKKIQCEDPRVAWSAKRRAFYVMHVVWKKFQRYHAHQRLSIFGETWTPGASHNIRYGGNSDRAGGGTRHEKNWSLFFHDDTPMVLYSFYPHTVFSTDGAQAIDEHKTKSPIHLWTYGEIRGGTPPVRIGDFYVSFMHSSCWWKKNQKRYYMGAYIFEAKPPFKVSAITEEPILIGSDQDIRTLGGPPCIFPCGADFKDNMWLVAFGVNDEACGWIKIPNSKLMERMTKC